MSESDRTAKEELLALLLQEEGLLASETETIPRRSQHSHLTLSHAQQRLWFLDRFEDPGAANHNIIALQLSGTLHVYVLEQSLTEILRRHEVLRTVYEENNGQPLQVIRPPEPIHLEQIDLRTAPETASPATMETLIRDVGSRPFDLSQDLPWRVTLLICDANEFVLVFTLHHIISDAWSAGVLMRELAALYGAFQSGQLSPLPELSIQYGDFALWQREWLRGAVLDEQLHYWQRQLAGAPDLLNLNTDRPRLAVSSVPRALEHFHLDQSVTTPLKEISHQANATLFMTMLAGYAALLARFSGDDDITIGVPVANRRRREVEPLIGLFVNMLIMRADLSGDSDFFTLLDHVKQLSVEAFDHQDVPFERLVEVLNPERTRSHAPLFQVMFIFHNAPSEVPILPGLTVSARQIVSGVAQFDLTLEVTETGDTMACAFEYNAALFERETISRMIDCFRMLLHQAATRPDGRLWALPLLSEDALLYILDDLNATQVPGADISALPALFEATAERQPDAIALVTEGYVLTYRHLNERANRLAHYLISLGVGVGVRVGICLERSLEMVIAMLGILKAGGAYVPLDPSYPAERLAFMSSDAEVACVLTTEPLLSTLPADQAHLILLDHEQPIIGQASGRNPNRSILPDNAAYVMYTSGSTGKPKGVIGLHRGIVNRIAWMADRFPFQAGDVCCQKTSMNFVDAVWEIFGPLVGGVPLVILSDAVVRDIPRLVDALAAHRIRRIVLVPSLLRAMLETGPGLRERLPDLIVWVTSGERLPLELYQLFQTCLPGCRLLNLYGSSEVAADVTAHEVQDDLIAPTVPIGRPIANTRVFLLNRALQPVPLGVTGEIYVAGAGLAGGYLHRPGLTAERFLPCPFNAAPGARLFKTGDLGRYLADGAIEFVGRTDDQLKLLGRRIEPGEIESRLDAHAAIRKSAVVMQALQTVRPRLTAYLTYHQGEDADVADLRSFLRRQLPEYMVPSVFVPLPDLPLTPNGKIDRRNLAARPEVRQEASLHRDRAMTPSEELLAGLWAEVLGLAQVQAGDDFFGLGGHSLLATQLLWRVRESFGCDVPVSVLFASPTVKQLAARIEAIREADGSTQLPAIVSVDRDRDLPASFAQKRLWVLDRLQGANATYNLSAAFQLAGPLDLASLTQTFSALLSRHESLRTTFVEQPDGLIQRVEPPRPCQLKVEDLTHLPEAGRAERVAELAQREVSKPFDLALDLPLRVTLFQLGTTSHVLLLVVHHIAFDGWSTGIFLRELRLLYQAYLNGEEAVLPEPLTQYGDFAVWQRQLLQEGALDDQLDYWKQHLAGAPTHLDLPTDRSRPTVQTHRGARQPIHFHAHLITQVRALSRHAGATLFMTLCAAYAVMLARYSGQYDVVIGTPIANRTQKETEDVIGFFANTLALRIELDDDPSFEALLQRVRAAALDAYANQDAPFDVLVNVLQPTRDLSHTPLFQTMIVLQDTHDWQLELDGLRIEPMAVTPAIARFDLTLILHHHEDGLSGSFEYNCDLFDAETIERMAGHFTGLLEAAIADPTCPASRLQLMNSAELQQIARLGRDGSTPLTEATCLHHVFEQQARRIPDAIALCSQDAQLSYRHLNRRANLLAQHLLTLGVQPGVVVGLCVERSFDLMIGLLGILKAGGAYLPLDPNYPRDRLAFMLTDSAVPILVTQQHLLTSLPPDMTQTVILDTAQIGHRPDAEINVDGGATIDDLACVIYTSGSVGHPKGVMSSHRGLDRMAGAGARVYDVGATSRILQLVSLSFDVATADIAMAFVAGATLCFAPAEDLLPGPSLLRILSAMQVSHLSLPASLLIALPYAPLPALEVLVVGGEVCPIDVAAQWSQGRKVFNAYGPTETTVVATTGVYTPGQSTLPIGRPIAGAHVHILDHWGQPVPIGLAGELYIGGGGVTRGYAQRASLTAERFLPDPFSESPGARLFRTGDVASLRANGQFVFLGRVDRQIKYHGFRIEPGEIEGVFRHHPAVEQALVVLGQNTAEETCLVAYVVPTDNALINPDDLRRYAKEKLPANMVPAYVVFLDALPLTPNGKVDYQALPIPEHSPVASDTFAPPQTHTERVIADVWRAVLSSDAFGVFDNFFDVGGHSLLAVRVHGRLQARLQQPVSVVDLFQFPTIHALARHLTEGGTEGEMATSVAMDAGSRGDLAHTRSGAIAIIGMACRYPGARDITAFWQNLVQGIESITHFCDGDLRRAGGGPDLLYQPHFVKAGGVVADVDLFDAGFFGFSPREATVLDPQQRQLLELAWVALETAGYDPTRYLGAIGVFAGVGMNTYLSRILYPDGSVPQSAEGFQAVTANDKDFVATQIAYRFNLQGPAVTVQSACSTSLVAIAMASQSLRSGACDMALAGGASIFVPQVRGYLYEEGMIMSPDGHCRAFDADAQGTVGSNGAGVVLLKPLEVALADGDSIDAVILGSAINNDGASKVGYTAPSVEGQVRVIRAVLAASGVEPKTIGYVETHGTGTPLGDPIEIRALTQAFGPHTQPQSCAIGSVKTNIGHTDTAAGVAGLIKAVLALRHGVIPPSLHFTQPNPQLDLACSPFYVNTALTPWPDGETPRRAGISSFGIGGTNAHVVLEQAPPVGATAQNLAPQVLVISARSETARKQIGTNLAAHLRTHPEIDLPSVAYTLQMGRRAWPHRQAVVCQTLEDAIEGLEGQTTRGVTAGTVSAVSVPVVFMFSGQGSQYVHMAADLYAKAPVFRHWLNHCCDQLTERLGVDLRHLLYPSPDAEAEAAARLRRTDMAQPALFVVEYALAQLWMSWGVKPAALMGHSLGEYVAACLAGVFTLEDALALVCERGRLMQRQPPGVMLAVALSEEKLRTMLRAELSVAAVNGPTSCVVSGPESMIRALQQHLEAEGYGCRDLTTSHAFHSAMMEPVLQPFTGHLAACQRQAPAIPMMSTLNGQWLTAEQAQDPAYWAAQLRQTVRFARGVETLCEQLEAVLLEVGPGRALETHAKACLARPAERMVLSSLPPAGHLGLSEAPYIMRTVGQLWITGVDIDWAEVHAPRQPQRLPLPTYPFEYQSYWGDTVTRPHAPSETRSSKPSGLSEWFYLPSWKRSVMTLQQVHAKVTPGPCLILADASSLAGQLAERLRDRGQAVVLARPGDRFAVESESCFSLVPTRVEDYQVLMTTLQAQDKMPHTILQMWGLDRSTSDRLSLDNIEHHLDLGLYSLLALARAVGHLHITDALQILTMSQDMLDVTGTEQLNPSRAPILGAIKTIPLEYPNLTCRLIDLPRTRAGSYPDTHIVDHIAQELDRDPGDPVVAYRGPHRFVPSYEPIVLEAVEPSMPRLRQQGTYIITGGLGSMGLTIAGYLAEHWRANLVLISRTGLPERSQWPDWLDAHDAEEPVSSRIRQVQALEAYESTVFIYAADVADADRMAHILAEVRAQCGPIHGVVHAAGVADYAGVIHLRSHESIVQALAAKVTGTVVLDQLLARDPLDFMVLCSTLGSVLYRAKFGQVGYATANEFLDAFAPYKMQRDGTFTVAINWDDWAEAGMSVASLERYQAGQGQTRSSGLSINGMSSTQGVDVFKRILASAHSRVVVSLRSLPELLAADTIVDDVLPHHASQLHVRPEVSSVYRAPSNDTETVLAALWQNLFGIEQVGVDDHFFELGGHSLLAVELLSAVRDAFQVELPLARIFETPTIAAQAPYIEHLALRQVLDGTAADNELGEGEEEFEL